MDDSSLQLMTLMLLSRSVNSEHKPPWSLYSTEHDLTVRSIHVVLIRPVTLQLENR